MRMDKLTSRFQQALADAQSLAVGRDHNLLEPVHVLTALLEQSGGSTRPLLAQAGVNVPLLRERLGEALEKLPKVSGQAGSLSVGNDLTRLLNQTDKLAQQHGDAFIASEWFVLAALDDSGTLGMALRAAGAVVEHVRAVAHEAHATRGLAGDVHDLLVVLAGIVEERLHLRDRQFLVAAGEQRVQRQRVGVGHGVLLFHQHAEHTGLQRGQRAHPFKRRNRRPRRSPRR